MLTYRGINLAARGAPKPCAAQAAPERPVTAEPRPREAKQRNRLGRPTRERIQKDWNYTAPVLLEVERWLRDNKLTATRFGTLAAGDPRLVFDLRMGRDPSSRVVARIRAFMTTEASHGE